VGRARRRVRFDVHDVASVYITTGATDELARLEERPDLTTIIEDEHDRI